MPDEVATPPKSTAEDLKEKSPQAIVALTIVLLADLMHDKEYAKILKILAPLIALVVVLSVTKTAELSVFLFKHYANKPPKTDHPLHIWLKTNIKESERKLFWMRKNNPDYPELLEHTKMLRKRLRKWELGKLKVNVSAPSAAPSEPAQPPSPTL